MIYRGLFYLFLTLLGGLVGCGSRGSVALRNRVEESSSESRFLIFKLRGAMEKGSSSTPRRT